ncbi:hypothetical protein BH11GEM2_BH11GEM2_12590 [soil metagenome]
MRRQHTRIVLTPDGSIRHLEMDIRSPSEPRGQRLRHVVVDVDGQDVRISKKDSTGVRNIPRTPIEKFTISIVPTNAKSGTMLMERGTFRWAIPIEVL